METEHGSPVVHLLAAALTVCCIKTDEERLTQLAPLALSLFADGERLIRRVEPIVEPILIMGLSRRENSYG